MQRVLITRINVAVIVHETTTKLHGHNFQEIHSGVANLENLATEVWLNLPALRAAYTTADC
jgi:hypothetical protein